MIRRGILRRNIFGWSLYDMGDTAFSALFITFFFPVLIKVHLGGNELHIGLVSGVAMLLAALFVPIIGAVSDVLQKRRPFLFLFTGVCIFMTVLVPFSSLLWALVFSTLAILAYHVSLDVYDSLLVSIATKKSLGQVSGLGVAFGYVGTIVSLGIAYLILRSYGWETKIGTQLVLLTAAGFYLLFSIISLSLIQEKAVKVKISLRRAIKQGAKNTVKTLTHWKKHKTVMTFLCASLVYTDGMNTAIVFLYLFGRDSIGLSIQQFFPIFALMAVAAACGALFFGRTLDKLGPKRTLNIALMAWVAVIIVLMSVKGYSSFVFAGMLGGVGMGAVWTATRPMLIQLAPKHNVAEFFGFQGLTEKMSGIFGPVLFGLIAVNYGYTPALAMILVFFGLGLILMHWVPDTSVRVRTSAKTL